MNSTEWVMKMQNYDVSCAIFVLKSDLTNVCVRFISRIHVISDSGHVTVMRNSCFF